MTALPTALSTGTWTIDGSHSEFGFVARHAGISKVKGKFDEIGGTVTFAEEFENSTVEAYAQASSITTGNEQRDGHLQSGDFFLAEEHPQVTFTATKIAKFDGEEFELTGDLTMRGVTKSVTFDAEFNGATVDPMGNNVAGFSAKATVNRKDYGMTFDVALGTGELLVSDKIKIVLELELSKQA